MICNICEAYHVITDINGYQARAEPYIITKYNTVYTSRDHLISNYLIRYIIYYMTSYKGNLEWAYDDQFDQFFHPKRATTQRMLSIGVIPIENVIRTRSEI